MLLSELNETQRIVACRYALTAVVQESHLFRYIHRFTPPLAKTIRSILSRSYLAHTIERSRPKIWQKGDIP